MSTVEKVRGFGQMTYDTEVQSLNQRTFFCSRNTDIERRGQEQTKRIGYQKSFMGNARRLNKESTFKLEHRSSSPIQTLIIQAKLKYKEISINSISNPTSQSSLAKNNLLTSQVTCSSSAHQLYYKQYN